MISFRYDNNYPLTSNRYFLQHTCSCINFPMNSKFFPKGFPKINFVSKF